MCGISGILHGGDRRMLERMNDSLAHRGPDDHDVVWFDGHRAGLAHRRLAIIDLSPGGHQPLTDEDRTLWITFNGEIYNYAAIRQELIAKGHRFRTRSDTEVILKAFREWGEACLDRLNGQFAFAIFNTVDGSLFIARDRLGIKPLYVAEISGGIVFASEAKAIVKCGLVDVAPDYDALRTPTRFQVSPLTGFKGIRKLPPGCFLTVRDGVVTERSYWDIRPVESGSVSDAEAMDRLDDLLQDAVRLQMIADVPVGILLSGGLDSSVIAALMRRQTEKEIRAFTIKFSDRDQRFEQAVDDSFYARKLAGTLGMQYHEIEIKPDIVELLPQLVWHMDEPLADPAAANTYLISKAARDHGIVVLLNGMGGDEVFGGYRKHLACLLAETYRKFLPGPVRGVARGLLDRLPVADASRGYRRIRWAKRFLSLADLPPVERYLSADLSLDPASFGQLFPGHAYHDSHFYRSQAGRFNGESISYLTKMCLNDTKVFLPEHNLTYSDKASMMVGVEGRPPLIDHRIVEFMFTLPPHFRIRGRQQKFLLKEVARRYLAAEIVDRPKAPFGAPLRSWIRGPLAPMVADLLSERSLKARGFYEPSAVRRLIELDATGAEDHAHTIWMFLVNELWFRTFFGS